MPKQKRTGQVPFVILGSNHDQNVKFYGSYDDAFLYNKAIALLYILNNDEMPNLIEQDVVAIGGAKLSEKFLQSIRAEIFFTTLHQCETFFALLFALFQPLPHWVYLTTYKTGDIKAGVDKLIDGKIRDITHLDITTLRELVRVAVYTEMMPTDADLVARWDENLDNAAWIIEQIAVFFKDYDRAYNSYKHGLRVLTGEHGLSIAPQNLDGSPRGPFHVLQESEDAVSYLQQEPEREVDGEKEAPISEVTKIFGPDEAMFYLAKMHQMLETIRATRLEHLKGNLEGVSLNTYFGLNRQEVIRLRRRGEWKVEPMRADQGRAYAQWVANMRVQAAKSEPPSVTDVIDAQPEQEED